MARWNVRTRCPLHWCTATISRDVDIERHLKTHTKMEKDLLYCWGCPLTTLQQSNLSKHIKDHHSGKEKYKCADPSGCKFGANKKGAITSHRRKYHNHVPLSKWEIVTTSEEPAYERGTTVESSGSSLSYTSDSPATSLEKTQLEFLPSSLLSPSLFDMDPAPHTTSVPSQAATTDTEQSIFTPFATVLQHADKCILPEAKILYPATNAGTPLDIELDSVLPQRECLPAGVNESSCAVSSSHVGTMCSYGSVTDVAAISSTFNAPTPVHAPGSPLRYQQDPCLVYPASLSMPAYSCPGPMDSVTNANMLNTPFPAYNAGPSGYQYQPQLVTTVPLQHSILSRTYPAFYQTYQTASLNASNLGMPQQPVGNALFAVQEQRPWMPNCSVWPSSNDISEYAFPAYASESFNVGAYEGNRYP
ncbi:hypothetical protein DFS33DRAFT_1274762 [Desarmillaria ectypa]|nr:hypothetical protein DFS33DRAFT_1274762 [Desarmillaria ectypa]